MLIGNSSLSQIQNPRLFSPAIGDAPQLSNLFDSNGNGLGNFARILMADIAGLLNIGQNSGGNQGNQGATVSFVRPPEPGSRAEEEGGAQAGGIQINLPQGDRLAEEVGSVTLRFAPEEVDEST